MTWTDRPSTIERRRYSKRCPSVGGLQARSPISLRISAASRFLETGSRSKRLKASRCQMERRRKFLFGNIDADSNDRIRNRSIRTQTGFCKNTAYFFVLYKYVVNPFDLSGYARYRFYRTADRYCRICGQIYRFFAGKRRSGTANSYTNLLKAAIKMGRDSAGHVRLSGVLPE